MRKICLILVFLLSINNSVQASQIKADPTLIITTLDGKNFDLKEKQGKVVIINFWAEWCAPCRKEMLILDQIYRQYKTKNLEIIGINIGHKKERQKASKISSSLSYPNAMLIDATQTNLEEPSAIPLSYIIDKKGHLIKKLDPSKNPLTIEDFEEIIKPLL